jgi:membrane-bound lytic murein transglycosylase A
MPPFSRFLRIVVTALCATSLSSAARAQLVEPLTIPDAQLEPLRWAGLDGWASDDHVASFSAFAKSCQPFRALRELPPDAPALQVGLWRVCQRAASLRPASAAEARAFFEENFRPVAIARIGEVKGLLTGYFEPVVNGSRFPSPEFHVPIYRRPPDLLVDGQPVAKGTDVPNRAVINHRNGNGELVPYYDRAAIENGALDGQRLEICWVRDPFEALSIQIQGSARIRLEDGTMLRINYDGHNGFPYTAVGRILIEQYGIPADQMSMERIRQWMVENPEDAPKLRQTNQSFVFFRVVGLTDQGEPIGGQGIPLSPGRSIAVDRVHIYGTPFFIMADLPIESAKPITKFRRLMIAQDTGSAIIGPARADLYWGAGDVAGRIAGRIRQLGQFVILLPRELDMVAAGRHTPLPPRRPTADEMASAEARADTAEAESPKPEPPPAAVTKVDALPNIAPASVAPASVAPPSVAKAEVATVPPAPEPKTEKPHSAFQPALRQQVKVRRGSARDF